MTTVMPFSQRLGREWTAFRLAAVLLLCLLGAYAHAAISIVGTDTYTSSSNIGSVTLTAPAGILSGDVMLVQIMADVASVGFNVPAGWTAIATPSGGSSTGFRHTLYYRVASGAEGSSNFTWGLSSSMRAAGGMIVLRGVDTTAPLIDAQAAQAGGGSSVIAPAVTASTANSLALTFFASDIGGTLVSANSPLTTGYQTASGAGPNGVAITAAYQLLASAGTTGGYSAAADSSPNVGHVLIFRPSVSCFSDSFGRAGVGSDWAVSSRGPNAFTPFINNGRLRLTSNTTNQATAAALQKTFPAAGNRIEIVFDYYGYNGTSPPADGIAVILSDASITPQPGGYGGSLGYAPNGSITGFAGGWLGIGLDEYGNYSNPTEGRTAGPGQRANSVAVRGSRPGYRYLAGTATLGTAISTTSTTPHRYRIVVNSLINGQSIVSVERDTSGTGTNYVTLISNLNAATATGQVALPSNLVLSLTGSTGGSTNIHEIDNLQVCALQINGVGTQIDHIRFDHAGQASTCAPSDVVVRACMDATCSSTYPGPVTVSLEPSGWVGGDTQTIVGSGSTLQLQRTSAGAVTLDAGSTSPPLKAFSVAKCYTQSGTSCSLSFVDDPALLFTVVDNPSEPNGLIAGKTSSNIALSAVRKDLTTNACVPAFANVNKSVRFWSAYVNPNTGTQSLSVNGSVIAKTSPGTALTLPFDAGGKTQIQVHYPDAGQMQLNARVDDSSAPVGSDTFAVRPAGFCIDSTTPNWNCTAGAACTPFVAAGDPFNVRIRAMAWNGSADLCTSSVTPNYRQTIPLSTALVAPAAGRASPFTVSGSALPSAVTFSAAEQGVLSATAVQTEVGVFRFGVEPIANDYFGLTVPSASANTGRFIPAGLTISDAALINRSDLACSPASNFTYLGEPLRADFKISAVNRGGSVTQNYFGDFARLNLSTSGSAPAPASLNFGAQQGATRFDPARLNAVCANAALCGTWPAYTPGGTSGTAAISAHLQVNRVATPEPPYASAVFGSGPSDADGVTLVAPDFDRDLNGTNDGARLGNTRLLYGRLRLQNAYGSELLRLPVPADVEFRDTLGFRVNSDDSCTSLPVPVATSLANSSALNAVYCSGGLGIPAWDAKNRLTTTNIAATLRRGAVTSGNATVLNGQAGLLLRNPSNVNGGPGVEGYADISLLVPDYLRFNWNGQNQNPATCGAPLAGDTDLNDDNPRARVRFGGNKRPTVIYMREMFF